MAVKFGKRIAITGNIGMGKSYITQCFKELGHSVYNFDDMVHELLLEDVDIIEQVAQIFPQCVEKKVIDKKLLSDLAFKDSANLAKLESILHPVLRQIQQHLTRIEKDDLSVVIEIPLLFEKWDKEGFDYIILAHTTFQEQKKRVLSRKGMTEEKFNAIMGQQIPSKEKFNKSDFIIDTTSGKLHTFEQIRKLVNNATG